MSQYIQNGIVIDYTNPTAEKISYGDIVTLGTRVGIAAEDIETGSTGGIKVEGVFEVPAVNTEEFAVGDILYLDVNGNATKTQGELTVIIGWAILPKVASGATAYVKLG